MKFMVLSEDRLSWYEFNQAAASKLRASYAGNHGVSYFIHSNEMVEHYMNENIIKSVRFRVFSGDTAIADESRLFEQGDGEIHLVFSTASGEIVQGNPGRLSYFESLLGGGTDGFFGMVSTQEQRNLSREAVDRIGHSVISIADAANRLSAFWYNGTEWVRVASRVDMNTQSVVVATSRLGMFQVRQAVRLGDATLVQVYPRIFTPNNDGHNDVVIFQFGDLDVSNTELTGEIFDLNGNKIAALQRGPDPNSTLKWDGKDSGGSVVPGGIYVYQISA
jgi:hypothetical protein